MLFGVLGEYYRIVSATVCFVNWSAHLLSAGYVCDGEYNTVQVNIDSPICLITWWPCCPRFASY